MFEWTATLPRGSWSRSLRIESSARIASICSNTVSPGGGSTPSMTTLPISPPAWQPTTVRTGRAGRQRIAASGSSGKADSEQVPVGRECGVVSGQEPGSALEVGQEVRLGFLGDPAADRHGLDQLFGGGRAD